MGKIIKIINYILTAAILMASMPSFGERIGQLFFSPEERKLLDRQRQNPSPVYSATGSTITLNGVVQGSSGKATIWVNGVAHDQAPLTTNITQSVSIRVPETGQAVQLKPGQTYNSVSGQIIDNGATLQNNKPDKPKTTTNQSEKPLDRSKDKRGKK